MLRRIGQLVRGNRGKLVVVLLLMLVSVGFNLLPPLLIRDIIDHALAQRNIHLLVELIAGLAAALFGGALIGIAQSYALTLFSVSITAELQRQLFRAIQKGSARFYNEMKPGDLMARFQNDATGLQGMAGTFIQLINSALQGVGALFVLFTMDWQLAAICVGSYLVYFIPIRPLSARLHLYSRKGQQTYGMMSDWLQQSMEGIRLIKSFAAEDKAIDRYAEHLDGYYRMAVKSSTVWRLMRVWNAIVQSIGPAIAFWYGGHQLFRGAISLGTIIAFTTYLGSLFGVAQSIGMSYARLKQVAPMIERIDEIIHRTRCDHDPTGSRCLPAVQGEISFHNVHFAYRTDVAILQGVSFTIRAGQRVAFVGPTGSGKSTILSLLLRLFDPDEGNIMIDGVSLKEIDPKTWRKQVAYVSQEPFLFHASLRHNLLYGNAANEAAMIAATSNTAIHESIASLGNGYETIVGERGVQLSGGQRQRVVLARALLRNPRILILDEATSALDNKNEAFVQQALAQWSLGRTTIVVAHRLSTVVDCDNIFVLECGRIVEQGTHEQLLLADGLYARLAQAQEKEA